MSTDATTNLNRFAMATAEFRDEAGNINPDLIDWGIVNALAAIEPTIAKAVGGFTGYEVDFEGRRVKTNDPPMSPVEMLLVAIVAMAGEKAAAVDRAEAIERKDRERREVARKLIARRPVK